MPTGVLVISFTVHKKETEAYVNNGAIIRKCLYIIKENRLGGERAQNQERDNAGRARRRTWRNVSSLVFQLRLLI